MSKNRILEKKIDFANEKWLFYTSKTYAIVSNGQRQLRPEWTEGMDGRNGQLQMDRRNGQAGLISSALKK